MDKGEVDVTPFGEMLDFIFCYLIDHGKAQPKEVFDDEIKIPDWK